MSDLNLAARLGEKAGPFGEAITKELVRAFRAAVGASGTGVPPTFVTRYRVGEFELFRRLGIELSSVLHAEQAYEYGDPIAIGDALSYETVFAQAVAKRELNFLTFDSVFTCQRDGRRVAVGSARTTIMVRGAAAAAGGADGR